MGRETWHSVEWEKDKLASTSTVRPSIGPFARVAVIVFTFLFEGLTPFVYYQSHELNVPASLPTELHAASQLIPTACVHIYGAIFITCLSPLQPKEDQKQLFNVDPSMMTGGLRRYFGRFFLFSCLQRWIAVGECSSFTHARTVQRGIFCASGGWNVSTAFLYITSPYW